MRIFSVIVVLALLSGCASQPPAKPNDPHYAPVMVPSEQTGQGSNGSLFREAGALDLFSDRKAKRVGDILTVVLQETTVSRKNSSVDVSKESEISIPEVAGAAGTLLGRAVGAGGYSLGTELGAERDFSGTADADQSNNLRGSIAVNVVDVWPNGTLVVRGEKWMTLNRGDEFIRISGLVRPDDISPENTVLSTRIADARISYSGTGALAQSQAMGWLNRFFNSEYWPF